MLDILIGSAFKVYLMFFIENGNVISQDLLYK